jgi:meiotic recombination protein DMC1
MCLRNLTIGVDGNAVLDNIMYTRALTHEHQMNMIIQAAAMMIEEKFALIVVDSATALFRVDFQGRGQLSDRQQR